MIFSLYYSINYFKNNNCFLMNLFFFFSLNASFSERFAEKCSRFYSNAGHYKDEFECSFPSRKYWSRVTLTDCKCKHNFIMFKHYNPFYLHVSHIVRPLNLYNYGKSPCMLLRHLTNHAQITQCGCHTVIYDDYSG